MIPEDLRSGRRWRSPSRSSQAIFSQVTITSPKAASTTGFPESSAATLRAPAGSWGAGETTTAATATLSVCHDTSQAHAHSTHAAVIQC